jgi:hypothetical protein
VATPEAFNEVVPRTVVPSSTLTVPTGDEPPTVIVSVTLEPT